MRVPMSVRRKHKKSLREQGVESMNISLGGTYFAAEGTFDVGEKIEVSLRMPDAVVAGQKTEWCFTGRVAHVDQLGKNGKIGVGVHFLYYTAGARPSE